MSNKNQMLADGQSFGPYSGGDDLGAVVAEIGSYTTKMGYAGEDAPRSIFRTSVAALRGGADDEAAGGGGKRAGGRGAPSALAGSPSGGNRITKTNHGDWWHRTLERDGTDGRWELVSPLDQGTGLVYRSPSDVVVPSSGQGTAGGDGDAMEVEGGENNGGGGNGGEGKASRPNSAQLNAEGNECYDLLGRYLRHGFSSSLLSSSSDQPLVLIERSYNPPPIRQKCLEVLFEELQVPAAFLARDAVMSCYAVGRSTGTVVDVGHSGTVVTPVYDGFVENRAILRSPVGGQMLDQATVDLLDTLYRDKRSKSQTSKADPNEPPYVMPLYQVRNRRAKGAGAGPCRRTDAMHREARLYVGRTAKEFGVAAAVAGFGYSVAPLDGSDSAAAAATAVSMPAGAVAHHAAEEAAKIRTQYINAPKAPFDLPDGTVVDLPVVDRFDAAEIMFGKDSGNTKRREEATEKLRKKLDDVIAASEDIANADEDDDDDDCHDDMGSLSASGLRCVKTKDAAAKNRGRRQPYTRTVRRSAPYLSGQIGELTSASLPTMVCDAAFKCDRDQQAQLLGNVVLSGGGACLGPNDASFSDRLRDEVEAIIHTHTPGWKVKVLSPDRRERSYCSWLGGSIMASIGMFNDFWITKKEYEEYGPSIVNRKCP
jgi:actin-related protein